MDDVVVVGGGIIVAATAYFLSKEGRKVRVEEGSRLAADIPHPETRN